MNVNSDLRNEKNRDWADLQLQKSWPGGTEATKEWSGLNIMLIEAELKNPILRLAWQTVTAEPEYLSVQAKIASLFVTKGQPLPKFRELLEHDITISTLFSHPDFGLWDPQTWAIPPTANPRSWHRDHVFTAKEVAQKNIVCWDGKENLRNCVENKFGSYKDSSNQWVYLHLCNKPAFMFVAYEDDGSNGHEFTDLQTLSINVEGWHVEPGVSPVLETIVVKYTLIAAVRMSSGPNPRESVRLYALNGGSLIPPASARISQVTSNIWLLGKGADSYMLVYAKSTTPFRVPLNRTEETQAVAHESVDRQGANVDFLGDPALDWVQAPSVSEREGETDHDFADIDMLEAASSSDSQESSASQVHATVTQHSQAIENQTLDPQPMASEPHSIIQTPENIGQAKSIHQPTMAFARTISQPSLDTALGMHPQRLQYIAALTTEIHSSEKPDWTLPKKPPTPESSTRHPPQPRRPSCHTDTGQSSILPGSAASQQARPIPQFPPTFEAQQALPNPQIAQPQLGHSTNKTGTVLLFSSGNSEEKVDEYQDGEYDEQGEEHDVQHVVRHPFGPMDMSFSSSHWQPSGQEQTYTNPSPFVTPQDLQGQVPLTQTHHTPAMPSGYLRRPVHPTLSLTSQMNQGHPNPSHVNPPLQFADAENVPQFQPTQHHQSPLQHTHPYQNQSQSDAPSFPPTSQGHLTQMAADPAFVLDHTPYQTSDSFGNGYGYGYGQASNSNVNQFGFGPTTHNFGYRQSSNLMANPFGLSQEPPDPGRRGGSRGGRGRRSTPRSKAATGANTTFYGQGGSGRGGNNPFGA
ncbi:hypothetical protein SCUP234_07168 [Seiridium cupressi]